MGEKYSLGPARAPESRTAAQRNHDAMKVALRQLLSSGALGSHRGLPVTAIPPSTSCREVPPSR
ncbi:DUF222 domain-containing protein [Rhodococcus sp. NPDC127528]|uniref:DUF222 domain-containing protein n=1 Tax=unclassified Rhodococcus (in: high G+C Gram-positive bacteria) TaxID=192944 RepID=UPI0036446862